MITLSIVSHGHGAILQDLLEDLLTSTLHLEVILTVNAPELEPCDWVMDWSQRPRLRVVCNERPNGFAANHNRAFEISQGRYFCVLNPDIRVKSEGSCDTWDRVLRQLMVCADVPQCGLSYPAQISTSGDPLDFERVLVTPWQLILRHVFRRTQKGSVRTDWVNGSCVLFRSDVYHALHGFDERYHLYCEDVDICIRLRLAGYALTKIPCTVVHDTRRSTLKDRQHFVWHIHSLIKLWMSGSYWKYFLLKRGG